MNVQGHLNFMCIVEDWGGFKSRVRESTDLDRGYPEYRSRLVRVPPAWGTVYPARLALDVLPLAPFPIRLESANTRGPIGEDQEVYPVSSRNVSCDGSSTAEGFIIGVRRNDED